MSNAPVIEAPPAVVQESLSGVAVATPSASPPLPTVQTLTIQDIIGRIRAVLMADGENGGPDGYGLTQDQVNQIEQLGQVQVGELTWKTGALAPGNDTFHVLAMYNGEANDRIAENLQGDVRAYLIPRTVVQPGAKEYRRYTFNTIVNRTLTHRMTLESFIEAVAYEELCSATETGIVEGDDEEPEEEK